MVTHAFGNDDRTSELEWMESWMHFFVVRAENTFRSLHCKYSVPVTHIVINSFLS